ncbi:inhibitor of growth proteins N-terminal histone-binding-domain-containing protein [Apodospora peruviana]|uniref:Chromatin modification-related protein n=1 Tax=Apodospora peruviana TaxID=516989 RepID=A0AAE0IQ66_9PEZI|nr:inhibitor of growth proteins N-terminal histone-binding-domain-containing protein [Apodospora peruviana]
MPRDDLSIDFVVKRMPPVELLDPAMILDEWINRTQNLPEEIRFLQDEIADKDRQYDKLVKEIEERDGRIQKWIKANGSHQNNPKEEDYRKTIRKNFALAEQLSMEKIALTQKLQQTMDKHVRYLDGQIKALYDRNELGFNDPDELPSLLRPSAANIANSTPVIRPVNGTTNPVTAALSHLANNVSQTTVRLSNSQLRNTQTQQHGSASAPATPAASMIMNRQARESSAGPGGGAPKRGPRAGINLPTTSSGLARHSSLGPGTPKAHQTATGGVQRAGSAGPRAIGKGSGGAVNRKSGTPSSTAGGRKKGSAGPGGAGGGSNKSGLSRVKRAAKNSPSSAAESELSDADSGSADESDAGRTGGRNTPQLSRSGSNQATSQNKEGSHDREPGSGGGPRSAKREDDDDDAMDLDDDEAGDDKKYCMCQNVSFGDMVACDNDDCPFEWFHWSCVGLKSEPNGKWFCPVCTENLKKKGGRAGS